jgi:hypothetical protein
MVKQKIGIGFKILKINSISSDGHLAFNSKAGEEHHTGFAPVSD